MGLAEACFYFHSIPKNRFDLMWGLGNFQKALKVSMKLLLDTPANITNLDGSLGDSS